MSSSFYEGFYQEYSYNYPILLGYGFLEYRGQTQEPERCQYYKWVGVDTILFVSDGILTKYRSSLKGLPGYYEAVYTKLEIDEKDDFIKALIDIGIVLG